MWIVLELTLYQTLYQHVECKLLLPGTTQGQVSRKGDEGCYIGRHERSQQWNIRPHESADVGSRDVCNQGEQIDVSLRPECTLTRQTLHRIISDS